MTKSHSNQSVVCPECKGKGYLTKPEFVKNEINLLSCRCGHGGIWHSNVYGVCNYRGGCNCQKMDVDFAIIDHKRLSKTEYDLWLTDRRIGKA